MTICDRIQDKGNEKRRRHPFQPIPNPSPFRSPRSVPNGIVLGRFRTVGVDILQRFKTGQNNTMFSLLIPLCKRYFYSIRGEGIHKTPIQPGRLLQYNPFSTSVKYNLVKWFLLAQLCCTYIFLFLATFDRFDLLFMVTKMSIALAFYAAFSIGKQPFQFFICFLFKIFHFAHISESWILAVC